MGAKHSPGLHRDRGAPSASLNRSTAPVRENGCFDPFGNVRQAPKAGSNLNRLKN